RVAGARRRSIRSDSGGESEESVADRHVDGRSGARHRRTDRLRVALRGDRSAPASHEAPTEVRSINVNKGTAAPEAFTVNIDRILKRIADLEADIVQAQDANAVLLKRNEALQAERDQHAARVEALTAEGARLAEHHTLADEMAQRTEKQLREELQRRELQLKELQDNHAKKITMSQRTPSSAKDNSE